MALALCIFAASALYSSIGHAGASGYLAAMALFGIAPETMRPAALTLNVLVGLIATYRYRADARYTARLLRLLLIGALPASFVGGAMELPDRVIGPIVGAVLVFAAIRTIVAEPSPTRRATEPSRFVLIVVGLLIGLLSGLTGIGGSIFLSPIVIGLGWATVRESAFLAASFVLLNSIAALAGSATTLGSLPPEIVSWGIAAVLGALVGTELGRRGLSPRGSQYVLAAILIAAGLKMIWTTTFAASDIPPRSTQARRAVIFGASPIHPHPFEESTDAAPRPPLVASVCRSAVVSAVAQGSRDCLPSRGQRGLSREHPGGRPEVC